MPASNTAAAADAVVNLLAGVADSFPASWQPADSNDFVFALLFGISVLVIACPCAVHTPSKCATLC